jgi:hypothetical protein
MSIVLSRQKRNSLFARAEIEVFRGPLGHQEKKVLAARSSRRESQGMNCENNGGGNAENHAA